MKDLFFVAVPKYVFVKKRSDFVSSSALGDPYRGRAHRKDLAVFRPKKFRPQKKIKKHVGKLHFSLRFQKNVFSSETERLSLFFCFWPLVPPSRGAH